MKKIWFENTIAKPANNAELEKDALGFTNPNLHRRIDETSTLLPNEIKARNYKIVKSGVNSLRFTQIFNNDETQWNSNNDIP